MLISEAEFGACISEYGNVLYLCHRNADPDAIGSAFALQQAFGGTIAAVDDLSRTGQALANAIGAEVQINPRAKDYDLVVVVDTSVRLQLGDFNLASYAIVDHHLDRGLLEEARFYIQKPCKSSAEVVWTILKENGCRASREMALGLLVGLISDTGRFRRASPEAFRTAAELLEAGGFDYEEAVQTISLPADISQRIAILKAAGRAVVKRQGNWLIASTQINSFEGSAAMALVDLGVMWPSPLESTSISVGSAPAPVERRQEPASTCPRSSGRSPEPTVAREAATRQRPPWRPEESPVLF